MSRLNTILIIDDTITNLTILANLLDKYDVIESTSGADALDIIEDEEHIDLILLDIMMPKMDGYEVCQRLKANNKTKDIPVIFITAKTDEQSVEKAFDVGGIDYVAKPFRPKELLARVKTQLNIQYLKTIEMEHHKQKAFSSLMHNIAHHWRQPLSVISTYASSMSMQEELGLLNSQAIIKNSNNIVEQCEYLSKVIETFTSFVNNSNNQTEFYLQDLIKKNYSLLFHNANTSTVNIELDDSILLNTHYSQLLQVLLILTTNSIEFKKDDEDLDHLIYINSSIVNSELEINIYDNGLGIEEENIAKVFEPYFTTKHKSQEKGMGLFIAYNIITQSLLGKIETSNISFEHNKQIHSGTNFKVTIPLNTNIKEQ